MIIQPHPYQPVVVGVAAGIAKRFSKDIVIIVSWDARHNLIHTTTWGQSANDKLVAADAGETIVKAIGCDLQRQRIYEDFRLDAARWKEENDRLKAQIANLTPSPIDALKYADACSVVMELVRDYGDGECTAAWRTIVDRLNSAESQKGKPA